MTAQAPLASGGFLVNLLPEELSAGGVEIRGKLLQLGLLTVLAAALVVGAYLLLEFYQSHVATSVAAVVTETSAVDEQIASLRSVQREANTFVAKVNALQVALGQHIRWSYFFDRLERYTLPTVTYGDTFQGTTAGTLALTGTAPTVEEVAHQLAVFQRSAPDLATVARLEGVQRGGRGGEEVSDAYTFTISLTLVPDVFVTPPATTAAQTP